MSPDLGVLAQTLSTTARPIRRRRSGAADANEGFGRLLRSSPRSKERSRRLGARRPAHDSHTCFSSDPASRTNSRNPTTTDLTPSRSADDRRRRATGVLFSRAARVPCARLPKFIRPANTNKAPRLQREEAEQRPIRCTRATGGPPCFDLTRTTAPLSDSQSPRS